MEEIKKYAKMLVDKGLLCGEYANMVLSSLGKYTVYSLLCDANGAHFFLLLDSKGVETPYNSIASIFAKYINGQCKVAYKAENGREKYTSTMYVLYDGEIECNTTILTLLGCNAKVRVEDNGFSRIYIDAKSSCDIILGDGARAEVYVADGGIFRYDAEYDSQKRIKVYEYGRS